MNLADYQDVYHQLPQIHFIGKKDTVVPNHLTENFVKDKSTIVTVEKADHQKGYQSIIQQIYQSN